MSRFVETYIRGCQNYPFLKKQDFVNILIGSLLKHFQDGEPVIIRDEDERIDDLFLEGPIGIMLTAQVHVFSDSVFCTGPGALDPTSASQMREKIQQNM